jgi:hypothetical protein
MENNLADRSVAMQVQNVYQGKQLNRFYTPDKPYVPFYGKSGKIYKLDDYTRFPTMEEVMKEYVPEVSVRKHQGNYSFKMVRADKMRFYDEDPLVLVDGIPIKNINFIISMNPLKIETMEISKQRISLGNNTFSGVVSYSGYDNNYSWLESDVLTLKTQYEGLESKRIFYAPLYDAAQMKSTLPDFRTLLLWEPDITTTNGTATIKFSTSDLSGKYITVLQGITADGAMGTSSFSFEVIKDGK